MKDYKVKSADAKHFNLTINDQEIGTLQYEKWFSFKAEMILEGNGTYKIEPKGFWGTTIELKQNEKVLLDFKMNWNGNIIINTHFDETENDFILRPKGIFGNNYALLDKDEEELLVVRPDFKWSKLDYDYNISTTDRFDNFSFNIILLLATIHCINYYITMISSTG